MKSFGARLSKLWAHANAWEKLILRLESYVINSIIPPKWPAHHCGRKQSEHRIKFQQAWKICPKMIWWISHNLFQLWLDAGPDVCAARVKRVLPLFLHQSRSRLSFGWILSAASACSVCVCLCGKGGMGRLSLELVVCGCLRRRGKIVCFSDFSDQKKKTKTKNVPAARSRISFRSSRSHATSSSSYRPNAVCAWMVPRRNMSKILNINRCVQINIWHLISWRCEALQEVSLECDN